MPTIAELQQRLEQNDSLYGFHFAGRPRITRDISRMDELIRAADDVAKAVRTGSVGTPSQRQPLLETAERQVDLFTKEKAAILDAQRQGGAAGLEASLLGTRANFVFHRYTRHFSGQQRSSRDLSLLLDMVAELKAIEGQMTALAGKAPLPGLLSDLEVVRGWLKTYEEERKLIAAAKTDGTLQDQASALALSANELFAQYKTHFAGQPRVTRRPELLVRLVDALQQLLERMQALQAQGLHDGHNDGNIGIVKGRLEAWNGELAAIRADRQKASLASMVADLWTAAEAELESYGEHFAGQARKSRDLKKLATILDRLDEVERQMARLDQVQNSPQNQRNLSAVRDALALYIAEYGHILEAQQGNG